LSFSGSGQTWSDLGGPVVIGLRAQIIVNRREKLIAVSKSIEARFCELLLEKNNNEEGLKLPLVQV
jgi:hypothetical protein